MKILIIEDDEHILSFLTRGFNEDGHLVESSDDGEEGEYLAIVNHYDVIVLDWMLPHKSGIEIVQSLRNKQIHTPIMMLTAKAEVDDRVLGLRRGADDYLSKPFAYEELLARVEALYRRGVSGGSNLITVQNITLNLNAKSVKKEDEELLLSQKEFELLLFLVKNKNSMVTNAMIEEQLWSNMTSISSNVIPVTIYHLRKKIGKEMIKSFRGLGYKIEDQ